MTTPVPARECPRCGQRASGRFCSACGATLEGQACSACGKPVTVGARFCHHCGAPASEGVRASPPARNALVWMVPGIAVLALVAFLIGQRVGLGSSTSDAPAGEPSSATGAAPFAGAGGRAPDISQMTPDERARRLFDRVMRYSEEGKQDSAKFFAPMAIQAYEMLGSPDAHSRYDIGMIGAVSGDVALARAEADTILLKDRNHLLGLILAIKAAGLRGDASARAALQKRLVAAEPSERAKKLREYDDHGADIEAALSIARGAKP